MNKTLEDFTSKFAGLHYYHRTYSDKDCFIIELPTIAQPHFHHETSFSCQIGDYQLQEVTVNNNWTLLCYK